MPLFVNLLYGNVATLNFVRSKQRHTKNRLKLQVNSIYLKALWRKTLGTDKKQESWLWAPEGVNTHVRVSAASVSDAKRHQDTVRAGLTVDCESQGAQVTGLSAIPTASGVQVIFSLPAAACVEARVRNIAGRPIRTICSGQELDSGSNVLLWNTQTDNGLTVPVGIYLVELVARSATGEQSRALTQVRVAR